MHAIITNLIFLLHIHKINFLFYFIVFLFFFSPQVFIQTVEVVSEAFVSSLGCINCYGALKLNTNFTIKSFLSYHHTQLTSLFFAAAHAF